MLLPKLLKHSIVLNLDAGTRDQAFEILLQHLPVNFPLPQKKLILESLIKREEFGTTATGEGVAFPRCVCPGVKEPIAVLGISLHGITYPSLGGEPVHLIFMSILPEQSTPPDLKQTILREAEKVFRDRFVCERLKIVDSPEEAFEILLRACAHEMQKQLQAA